MSIEGSNFPTIDLDTEDKINTGSKIYVYGFPSTGEFNASDSLQSTFTQGTVSGLKNSKTKTFQVIQTDAKVSPGSSGGPLLNEKGDVIGILTFATSSDVSGDTFAFAIPISLLRDTLQSKGINVQKSDWSTFAKNGIYFLQNNRCQKSVQSFVRSQNINSNFSVSKSIQGYSDKCHDIITSGKSIDTAWDALRVKLGNQGSIYWILAGFGLLFLIIIFVIISKLLKRINKDELQMSKNGNMVNLNTQYVASSVNLSNNMSNSVLNTAGTVKPVDVGVLNYVRNSRISGLTNDAIAANLRKGGWSEEEITRALAQV